MGLNSINNRAVLFDLDGVVIDSEPLYQKAEIHLFRNYGVELNEDDKKLFRGCSEDTFYKLASENFGIQENKEKLISEVRKYLIESLDGDLKFKEGFESLISELSGLFKLGLVTATPGDIVNQIDSMINLSLYFEKILTGDSVKENKPHPQPYLTMMDWLNVSPENTIIIEDSIQGVQSAVASNARVIALSGTVDRHELTKADIIVDNIGEISKKMINNMMKENW
tara:strand:- start:190 stop:864 length:675 start_codon:yes stop_codon:yes gene_type:complete